MTIRNITEVPDRWVVLHLPEHNRYKVFATWARPEERWQANSGIASVEQDELFYYFNGDSGSCYKCAKGAYGLATSWCQNVLDGILGVAEGRLTLVDNQPNWEQFIKEEIERNTTK